MTRRLAAVAVAVAACVILGGCVRNQLREDLETAIPAALVASDLGIIEAQAGKSIDGLSVNLWASPSFDRSEITAEDLREVLRIMVENNNIGNVSSLEVIGLDGSTPDDSDYVLLGAVGETLGFAADPEHPEDFTADYDEIVEMLNR